MSDEVRLTSEQDRREWLECLKAAATLCEAARPYILGGEEGLRATGIVADKLYREMRKRCVK